MAMIESIVEEVDVDDPKSGGKGRQEGWKRGMGQEGYLMKVQSRTDSFDSESAMGMINERRLRSKTIRGTEEK